MRIPTAGEARLQTTDLPQAPGPQLVGEYEGLSRGLSALGQGLATGLQVRDERAAKADAMAVDKAMGALRESVVTSMPDFLAQRGDAAYAASGAYSQALEKKRKELRDAALSNEEQRTAFDEKAHVLMGDVLAKVESHTNQQWRVAQEDNLKANIQQAVAAEASGLEVDAPLRASIEAGARELADSPAGAKEALARFDSQTALAGLKYRLATDDVDGAQAYLEANKARFGEALPGALEAVRHAMKAQDERAKRSEDSAAMADVVEKARKDNGFIDEAAAWAALKPGAPRYEERRAELATQLRIEDEKKRQQLQQLRNVVLAADAQGDNASLAVKAQLPQVLEMLADPEDGDPGFILGREKRLAAAAKAAKRGTGTGSNKDDAYARLKFRALDDEVAASTNPEEFVTRLGVNPSRNGMAELGVLQAEAARRASRGDDKATALQRAAADKFVARVLADTRAVRLKKGKDVEYNSDGKRFTYTEAFRAAALDAFDAAVADAGGKLPTQEELDKRASALAAKVVLRPGILFDDHGPEAVKSYLEKRRNQPAPAAPATVRVRKKSTRQEKVLPRDVADKVLESADYEVVQ